MMNKIILEAKGKLEDKELRKWVSQLATKIETLNDRTKRQTLQIRDLEKQIKEMKPCAKMKF
ncbi:MAG: hypothetical protein PHS54_01410 [Clostridia bacterium]|nr:hypothetical protein [Clostridia bacterium]